MSPCPDLDALAGWWQGELAGAPESDLEEHLLGCPACSRTAGVLAVIAEGTRALVAEGRIAVAVAPSFLARAAADGLVVREYRLAPGESVDCTIAPGDDLVLSRLQVPASPAPRVDLKLQLEGAPEVRMADVPVAGSELLLVQHSGQLRALGRRRVRVALCVGSGPDERILGEYTFHHAPS